MDVAQALANIVPMKSLPGTFALPGPSTLTYEYIGASSFCTQRLNRWASCSSLLFSESAPVVTQTSPPGS